MAGPLLAAVATHHDRVLGHRDERLRARVADPLKHTDVREIQNAPGLAAVVGPLDAALIRRVEENVEDAARAAVDRVPHGLRRGDVGDGAGGSAVHGPALVYWVIAATSGSADVVAIGPPSAFGPIGCQLTGLGEFPTGAATSKLPEPCRCRPSSVVTDARTAYAPTCSPCSSARYQLPWSWCVGTS